MKDIIFSSDEEGNEDKTMNQSIENLLDQLNKLHNEKNKNFNSNTIFVKGISREDNKKRVYDKKFSCLYCSKLVHKLSRHIKQCHSVEPMVQKMIKSTDPKEKEKLGEFIRHLGNYKHNISVLQGGEGDLIVVRRPSNTKENCHYIPCGSCFGFFEKRELHKHARICKFSKFKNKQSVREGRMMLLSHLIDGSRVLFFENVINTLKHDDIRQKIESDTLLMKFGEILYEKYGINHVSYIRQRLRQIGRLLVACDNNNEKRNITLLDVLKPKKLDFLIKTTKEITYSEDHPKQSISLALKIGHSLKKCATIAKSISIKQGNLSDLDDINNFIEIFPSEWADNISSKALRNLNDQHLDKDIVLPLTEDLIKLSKNLDLEIKEEINNVMNEETHSNWIKLAKATLCKLIVFNKRRGGEVARMFSDSYLNRPNWLANSHSEILNCLSPVEKELAKRTDMMKIKGKRGKHVPVLMTTDIVNAMDILCKIRIKVGIK